MCGEGSVCGTRGVCMVKGGMCGERGGMHGKGGACVAKWRACVAKGACVARGHALQGARMAGETVTAVDGTHSTGMHSSSKYPYLDKIVS